MPITSKFVCLNGRFIKEEELSFAANNRAFRYGDGFFETLHYGHGKIQLFDLHLKRIQKALSLLKMENSILINARLLHKEIVHLANANHFFKGARVRISIFRAPGGLYLPENNKANYLIENWPLEDDHYPINSKGLSIDVYSDIKKQSNSNLFYKSLNTQISILASLHKQELGVDDCLLINDNNEIIESTNSNVFFIKENRIYTPSNVSGCIHGIMREQVLKSLSKTNLIINKEDAITKEQITKFDEIFLTNAITGIQWIGAYKTRRFDNKTTKKIQQILVKDIFSKP